MRLYDARESCAFPRWDDVLILRISMAEAALARLGWTQGLLPVRTRRPKAALRVVLDACPAAALVLSSTWQGEGGAVVETVRG
jgi:hypothetical protein